MHFSINKTEKEERAYLESVKTIIDNLIVKTEEDVLSYSKDVQEIKDYLWENKADMDHVEKVSSRESITQRALTGEGAAAKIKRLRKLQISPYFGRIDFRQTDESVNTLQCGSAKVPKKEGYIPPIYIGIHSFYNPIEKQNLIYDWRAPVSAMFYDFELGTAFYEAPSGRVSGHIELKRQYRIRGGKMEFMLESSLNIHDDILQKELSKSSDEKMKNIVATIQRDQNMIIRNDHSRVLIIQGAAGSGKTSIALHRIAYLLYRHKDDLSSDDVLIISPNRIFADYISNVLPELGEDNIPETGMEDLGLGILNHKYKFTTFFHQISKTIDNTDTAFIERARFKSSFEFLSSLNTFLLHIENNFFEITDINYGRFFVPSDFVAERFRAHSRVPVMRRFKEVAKDIYNGIEKEYRTDLKTYDMNKILSLVKFMFKGGDLTKLYQEFFVWMGVPGMFKKESRSVYEYSDLYPMAYIKIFVEGITINSKIKHLLIDEMQDYTPVQYALLSKLFRCNKTILGDSNQSLDPGCSSTAQSIANVFPGADIMMLSKSYRSTIEITNFAQKISFNRDLTPIERHGKKPTVKVLNSKEDEINEIKKFIQEFLKSEYMSMGIICKTQKDADNIHSMLLSGLLDESPVDENFKITLLSNQTVSFVNGIVITTAHLAKGLEFDYVVVPRVSADNYKTEVDRKMLYIACTRAMHNLRITAVKNLSGFLT